MLLHQVVSQSLRGLLVGAGAEDQSYVHPGIVAEAPAALSVGSIDIVVTNCILRQITVSPVK